MFYVSAILRFPRNNLKRNGRVSRLNVARKRPRIDETGFVSPANVCADVFRRYRGRRIKLSSSVQKRALIPLNISFCFFVHTGWVNKEWRGGKKKKKISLFDKRKDSASKRKRGGEKWRSKSSNLASLHLINKNKTWYFETRHFHVPPLPPNLHGAVILSSYCHFRSVL